MIFALKVLWLKLTYHLRPTYLAQKCPHLTKKVGLIKTLGTEYIFHLPVNEDGTVDYCLACIGKMAIRCVRCDRPIFIGSPITLYVPHKELRIPKHAVRYKEDKRCFVGCLRSSCADTGGDRQGFWIPPGEVQRVPSAIEMLIASGGKGVVVIEDVNNPNDHGKLVRQ